MGRTKHQYYRPHPYSIGVMLKSRRNQIPLLKRKVRHSFRNSNKFADQLTYSRFNSNGHYKVHYNQAYQTGNLKGIKYDYGVKDLVQKLVRIKAKPEELKQFLSVIKRDGYRYMRFAGRKTQNWIGDIRKMLKRRRSLKPFRGHRKPGKLYKRELMF